MLMHISLATESYYVERSVLSIRSELDLTISSEARADLKSDLEAEVAYADDLELERLALINRLGGSL